MNAPRSKPVHEIRFSGVKAAIWRNEGEHGVRFNTTFSRSYRDGEQWKNTESFGRDDLLLLAKAANEAHTWIHQHGRETNGETPASTSANPPTQNNRPGSTPPAGTYTRQRQPRAESDL